MIWFVVKIKRRKIYSCSSSSLCGSHLSLLFDGCSTTPHWCLWQRSSWWHTRPRRWSPQTGWSTTTPSFPRTENSLKITKPNWSSSASHWFWLLLFTICFSTLAALYRSTLLIAWTALVSRIWQWIPGGAPEKQYHCEIPNCPLRESGTLQVCLPPLLLLAHFILVEIRKKGPGRC